MRRNRIGFMRVIIVKAVEPFSVRQQDCGFKSNLRYGLSMSSRFDKCAVRLELM